MKKFIKMCKKSQSKLKSYLSKEISRYGYEPIKGDGYLYAKGEVPVLVTAHMDTVHHNPVRKVNIKRTNNRTIISSPQGIGGDDRCGCYMILKLLEQGKRPYILFCEDEEIGGVGSDKFCNTEYITDIAKLKFVIELDRANANDAVFYDDGNLDFQDWIEEKTGYRNDWGSFSDIGNICPTAGISGVNLSCGYYKQHTLEEYVVFEEMLKTVKATAELIDLAESDEVEQFEYVETYYRNSFKTVYGKYDGWGYSSKDSYRYCEFIYLDDQGKENHDFSDGYTFDECVGVFLMNNPNVCWNDVIDYYEY